MLLYTRFEDENDGDERPASQGSTRRTKASALEDMITKDDRGWLDMASNEVGKDNRPPSTDSIKDKPSRPGKLFSIRNKQPSPEAGCLLYYIMFKPPVWGILYLLCLQQLCVLFVQLKEVVMK